MLENENEREHHEEFEVSFRKEAGKQNLSLKGKEVLLSTLGEEKHYLIPDIVYDDGKVKIAIEIERVCHHDEHLERFRKIRRKLLENLGYIVINFDLDTIEKNEAEVCISALKELILQKGGSSSLLSHSPSMNTSPLNNDASHEEDKTESVTDTSGLDAVKKDLEQNYSHSEEKKEEEESSHEEKENSEESQEVTPKDEHMELAVENHEEEEQIENPKHGASEESHEEEEDVSSEDVSFEPTVSKEDLSSEALANKTDLSAEALAKAEKKELKPSPLLASVSKKEENKSSVGGILYALFGAAFAAVLLYGYFMIYQGYEKPSDQPVVTQQSSDLHAAAEEVKDTEETFVLEEVSEAIPVSFSFPEAQMFTNAAGLKKVAENSASSEEVASYEIVLPGNSALVEYKGLYFVVCDDGYEMSVDKTRCDEEINEMSTFEISEEVPEAVVEEPVEEIAPEEVTEDAAPEFRSDELPEGVSFDTKTAEN